MSVESPQDSTRIAPPSPAGSSQNSAADPQASLAFSPSLQGLLARAASSERLPVLLALRTDQHQRWQRGEKTSVEAYQKQVPLLQSDPEALLDLIFSEIMLREEQGDYPQLEEYLQRFPAQEAQLRPQFEMHRLLAAASRQDESRSVSDRLEKGPRDPYATASKPCIALAETKSLDPRAPAVQARPKGDQADALPAMPGYEILGELGRGGMGVVYKAIQKATKRTVALKVMLHGAHASGPQRWRFEREIDLVASLRHPNIVNIYDSGSTPDGWPYFAMEYIEGRSLGDFLKSGPPRSLPEVLRLFGKIAAAVHYAHQRGVIHRDLKPGNIRLDAEGEPHILDFGLAKTTQPTAADEEGRQATRTGEFLGTPAYASPEQAAGALDRIDIRTDVYSLGVMLYEAVTSHLPYPLKGSLVDIIRAVRETEPLPPSSWRRSQAAGAGRPPFPIDAALEAIILKSLAKDPERRYASAGALADDLTRYLAGEPIQARPPSVAFLLLLWLRKNFRAGIWTVIIGFLCGGLSSTAIGLVTISTWLRKASLAYAELPSWEAPWLVSVQLFASPWRELALGLGVGAFLAMGLLASLLVRPADRGADVATGIATGLVAGTTAFTVCFGWLAVASETVASSSDLILIAKAQKNEQALAERYPDLIDIPEERRTRILAAKVLADIIVRVPVGIWFGMFGSLILYVALGVCETMLAGALRRQNERLSGVVVAYLEFLLICGLGICLLLPPLGLGLGVLPNYLPDPLVGNVGLVLFALAVLGMVRKWPGYVRAACYLVVAVNLARGSAPNGFSWLIDLSAYALLVVALVRKGEYDHPKEFDN